MKTAAMTPARSAPARAMIIRNAPMNVSPKPTPATAVPTRKAAEVVVAIAPMVTPTPASRNTPPASVARRGAADREGGRGGRRDRADGPADARQQEQAAGQHRPARGHAPEQAHRHG